ncbi:MAG: aspartate aminotransferase family protein [Gammaproteobacteria bacterium]|nr:aspartate aminotransferase family protein [Gammaproteobacteria bacterium]
MADRAIIGSTPAGGGVQHFWLPHGTPQLPRIARARGVYVWDTDGRRYIDATSGPVAVNLGHGNRRVLDAMRRQAGRVCFAYPSYFESEANTQLADLLCAHAGHGLDRAFFVSGGAEAVEKCLEFARLHAVARDEPGRFKVISRFPAFHGSTLATQALSEEWHKSPLRPMLQQWPKVPAPFSYRPAARLDAEADATRCAEALRETLLAEGADTVLAFIVEPIMGLSGGAAYSSPSYYRRIREICSEFGVLLIFDEIMSGAGRAGRFLAAHVWPEARPDLVVLAKGLGSGYYPIGAFLAPEHMVAAVVQSGGFHLGHTHKASPLACAVGLAVLHELISEDLPARAEATGSYLRDGLEALKADIPIIGDVRGKGLFNAIEFVADAETKKTLPREIDVPMELSRMAMERGLLIYARRTFGGRFGDWLMMTPPLISTRKHIDEIVDLLASTLRDYEDDLRRRKVLP